MVSGSEFDQMISFSVDGASGLNGKKTVFRVKGESRVRAKNEEYRIAVLFQWIWHHRVKRPATEREEE